MSKFLHSAELTSTSGIQLDPQVDWINAPQDKRREKITQKKVSFVREKFLLRLNLPREYSTRKVWTHQRYWISNIPAYDQFLLHFDIGNT